jgi:uncharacterized protein (DUF1778 family)
MTSKWPVKTYEEIAREYDAMKEAGTELDNLVPVKARVAKEPRAVFSVRMTPAELNIIESAAKKRGISISELIRTAALAAASEELDLTAGERESALAEVRAQVKALAETVSRI